jgi:IclR family pca regulon transcriptional regulator
MVLTSSTQTNARSSGLADGEDDADFVRALARGLQVIEAFDAAQEPQTLSQLSMNVGLSRGSTRRLLLTLEHLGYVGSADGRFFLLPRTLRLGHAFLSSQPIWQLTRPYLEKLVAETGESSSIAILDDIDIVYVARAAARRLVNDTIGIGTRFPAYANSMGKILLAVLGEKELKQRISKMNLRKITEHTIVDRDELFKEIQRVRKNGWATNDQEMQLGLRSIAVPLRDADDKVVAALNLSTNTARTSLKALEKQYLPPLMECASELSAMISWHRNIR